MSLLKYKTYTWPNDPETYRETVSREPLYVTQEGVTTYKGISSTHRIITGSGVFHGTDAYANFKKLIEVAEDNSAGDLIHPTWGTRHCYLTKLELNQEPRENYVAYSFEFTEAKSDGTIPR